MTAQETKEFDRRKLIRSHTLRLLKSIQKKLEPQPDHMFAPDGPGTQKSIEEAREVCSKIDQGGRIMGVLDTIGVSPHRDDSKKQSDRSRPHNPDDYKYDQKREHIDQFGVGSGKKSGKSAR